MAPPTPAERKKHREEMDDAYRAIGRYVVAFAEMLSSPRQLTVWRRNQRIDRQESLCIPRNTCPIAGRLVQLHQSQIGGNRVAVPHRQLLENLVFGG